MTIDEIYRNDELSVRSYNVCKYNELNSVNDLHQYFLKHKSFNKLRNCGRRSNDEIIEIYKKYKYSVEIVESNEIKPLKLENVIGELSRVQREVVNSFILVNVGALSVRSKNGIARYLDDNFKINNWCSKIFMNDNFILRNIENIGAKSIEELDFFINSIKDFIYEVSSLKDEKQILTLKNKYLIQKTFSTSDIPSEILEADSIFQLTDFLLINNLLFNYNQTKIVQMSFKFYLDSQMHSIENVALELDLSRERVRQIRKESVNELFQKLTFIKNFNDDLLKNYSLDVSEKIIRIKDDTVERVNLRSNTNFSKEFISCILSVYLNDEFDLVGNIEDLLQTKLFTSRNRHNWNNFYIIHKDLKNVDFVSLSNDISSRLNDRIEETYSFSFKSYLSKFITDSEELIEHIDSLLPIAETIINEEFNLYLDIDDNIVFKKNTSKQAYEYAFEALEILGVASKVEDIKAKILEIYPHYETDEAKVRVSMKRKDGFVPVGRASVFGLKKWESELNDFKGGTIRSITNEFLEKFDEPKHISEIAEYVLKFRPDTNEKSIYYNLRMEESSSFIFFKKSYVGLNNKEYSEEFEVLQESDKRDRNSWEDRYQDLLEFLDLENRLPFSANVPDEEIGLYRWLNVQKGKIKSKKLSSEKEQLVNGVFEKFPQINGRRRINSEEKYNELLNFIELHKRLPSANREDEYKLYQFFYNQRKLHNMNELDKNEKKYFMKVASFF
ncbi:helicase associated domain-containing protein [Chryseobacterium oryzae]|uniref:RNA polymerase alpha subunit C-terminal domain-containing protein n=1 Tax=Chryseobacterium oryzae TaxID=2929799 RepID=A0ABY4BIY7_9FLAO|nr:helicase associated domain-containing protein [Chryseobacterium oryzae]UOE39158.1 hypothetical protein MTP08_05155 [Chryseobacterium oryzae]